MPQCNRDHVLWNVVAHLEADQLEAWRKEIAPDVEREVFFASRVEAVETYVQRRRGGNVSVTISLFATQVRNHRSSYFFLQRAGNKVYRVVDPPSSKASG